MEGIAFEIRAISAVISCGLNGEGGQLEGDKPPRT